MTSGPAVAPDQSRLGGTTKRFPRTSLTRSIRTGGWAVGDQVLSSGTQLLLVLAVAHSAPTAVFGAVSVGVIVHGFFLGSVRALIGDVTLIRCRRSSVDAIPAAARIGLGLAVGFGVLSGALIALGGVARGSQVGHFLLLFAVAAPFVHAQDLLRSVAYGSRNVVRAVVLDGTWLVVQVLLLVVLYVAGRATATSIVLTWIGGAVCSLLVGWAMGHCRIAFRGARSWWKEEGKRGLGFLGDFLVSTGIVQVSFLILGELVLSLSEFGSFRLAFVALSPLANLLTGVRSLVLARLAGTGSDRALAFKRARGAVPVFVATAAIYGTMVSLLPTSLGELAFGDGWSSARSLVVAVAIGETFRLAAFPAIDFVKVFGEPGSLVRTRLASSSFVVLGILGGGVIGGAQAAVWGTAAAMALATAFWWRGATRSSVESSMTPSVVRT